MFMRSILLNADNRAIAFDNKQDLQNLNSELASYGLESYDL